MVTSLARQAVIIKCGNDTSIITGNYELSYAVGFLMNQAGISLPEEAANLKEMRESVLREYAFAYIRHNEKVSEKKKESL